MKESSISHQSTLDVLTKRISKLEKGNRTLKVSYFLLLTILIGSLLIGAAPLKPRTIEAEKFVLKDTNGKRRAVLHVTEQGGPGMHFYDTNEEARVFLGLSCLKCDDFTGLAFYDSKGEVRVSLITNIEGAARLAFRDSDGTALELMGIDPDGSSFLQLNDKNGKTIWQAP